MPKTFLQIALFIMLAGCGLVDEKEGSVVDGVDLDALFAPARAEEIEQASAAWEGRDVSAQGVELVHEDELAHPFAPDWRAEVRIYRHEVSGVTHYGAVVVPDEEPARARPVLLYLHGGDDGVSMSDVALALAFSPGIRDEFVVVVPSFRSEALSIGAQTFQSEGSPSAWDRDVDDTLALLNVALMTTPDADGERVLALGFSRGAGVGLLAGIRDARIDGVVNFFGPTDFLGPFARDVTRRILRGETPDLPGIDYLDQELLEPLQDGERTIDDVRLDLIRRSAVYYADRLPRVQIHHGVDDEIVPVEQGQALADALASEAPDHEAYFYEEGRHDPLTLDGSSDRVASFLGKWTNPPPA